MWRSPGAAIVLSVSSLAIAQANTASACAIRFDRTPCPTTIVGTGFINGARGIDDDRMSSSGDDLVNGDAGTDTPAGANGADDAGNGGRGPDADTADNTREFLSAIS